MAEKTETLEERVNKSMAKFGALVFAPAKALAIGAGMLYDYCNSKSMLQKIGDFFYSLIPGIRDDVAAGRVSRNISEAVYDIAGTAADYALIPLSIGASYFLPKKNSKNEKVQAARRIIGAPLIYAGLSALEYPIRYAKDIPWDKVVSNFTEYGPDILFGMGEMAMGKLPYIALCAAAAAGMHYIPKIARSAYSRFKNNSLGLSAESG